MLDTVNQCHVENTHYYFAIYWLPLSKLCLLKEKKYHLFTLVMSYLSKSNLNQTQPIMKSKKRVKTTALSFGPIYADPRFFNMPLFMMDKNSCQPPQYM